MDATNLLSKLIEFHAQLIMAIHHVVVKQDLNLVCKEIHDNVALSIIADYDADNATKYSGDDLIEKKLIESLMSELDIYGKFRSQTLTQVKKSDIFQLFYLVAKTEIWLLGYTYLHI